MMRKIWKYVQDAIQCVRLSYCIDNVFSEKEFLFKSNYAGTFDISCGMFSSLIISDVISLVLRDSDMDSKHR